MRVKVNHKIFDVQEVDSSLAPLICDEDNADMKFRMDGDVVCIKFGVDRMWIAFKKRGLYLIKPKTYSREELSELIKILVDATH